MYSDGPLSVEDRVTKTSPRAFQSPDGFGCLSKLKFGEWKQSYTPKKSDAAPEPVWWNIRNYGVFDCAAIFQTADSQGGYGAWEYGFFVELGQDPDSGLYLSAFEIRPGPYTDLSRDVSYLLLSATQEVNVQRFSVLETDCAAGTIQVTKAPSMWRTNDCLVPSQASLVAIARAAAARPPIGVLERIGEPWRKPGS